MINEERIRCECGWEGRMDELEVVKVFDGNREEPPEYENKCPCCDRPFDELEYVPLCVSCEDTYVEEDGDMCAVCRSEMDEHDGEPPITNAERLESGMITPR